MLRIYTILIMTCLFLLPTIKHTYGEGISVVITEMGIMNFKHEPFIKNDRVYIPLRDFSEEWSTKVNYDHGSKKIKLQQAYQTIELSLKNKGEAILKDNTTYVPLRFLSEGLDATVRWDGKNRTVYIEGMERFAFKTVKNQSFWIAYKTGEVYMANGVEAPKKVGTINHELYEYVNLDTVEMGDNTFAIKVVDNYGEPSIQYRVYTIVIKNNEIIHQENTRFLYHYEGSDLLLYNKLAILNSGRSIKLINSQGDIVKELSLTSNEKEQNYDLISLKPTYMLIRGNQDGLLLYVDRITEKQTYLYKVLIKNKNEIEYIEHEENGTMSTGDKLQFLGEKNGVLSFLYNGLFESGTYTFKIIN